MWRWIRNYTNTLITKEEIPGKRFLYLGLQPFEPSLCRKLKIFALPTTFSLNLSPHRKMAFSKLLVFISNINITGVRTSELATLFPPNVGS